MVDQMTVQTKSGRLLHWDGTQFVGDESDVGLASVRCESLFVCSDGVPASFGSLEGLYVGMTGSTNLDNLVASTRPLDFTRAVFPGSIGTWH